MKQDMRVIAENLERTKAKAAAREWEKIASQRAHSKV
jgi:hypothetical protein